MYHISGIFRASSLGTTYTQGVSARWGDRCGRVYRAFRTLIKGGRGAGVCIAKAQDYISKEGDKNFKPAFYFFPTRIKASEQARGGVGCPFAIVGVSAFVEASVS